METPSAAVPDRTSSRYPDQLEGELAGCQLQLELDTRTVRWHEELSGTLFLEGGGFARTVSVYVGIEAYPDQVARGQELLPSRDWKAVEVKPWERVRVCFALRMPGSVPFRRQRLRAVVRADWRHSTTLSAEIHVAPPLPFQQVAAVLEELTGVRVSSWTTVEMGDAVVARFVPPREGPKPFDALELELFHNNGMIYGTLTLDPLNRTFADRLRSAAGADRVSIPFRFPEADFGGVRAYYQQTLRSLMDDLHDLPIPAVQAAPSAATLPLPAGEPPEAV
jgi:hypothetical protein